MVPTPIFGFFGYVWFVLLLMNKKGNLLEILIFLFFVKDWFILLF